MDATCKEESKEDSDTKGRELPTSMKWLLLCYLKLLSPPALPTAAE